MRGRGEERGVGDVVCEGVREGEGGGGRGGKRREGSGGWAAVAVVVAGGGGGGGGFAVTGVAAFSAHRQSFLCALACPSASGHPPPRILPRARFQTSPRRALGRRHQRPTSVQQRWSFDPQAAQPEVRQRG